MTLGRSMMVGAVVLSLGGVLVALAACGRDSSGPPAAAPAGSDADDLDPVDEETTAESEEEPEAASPDAGSPAPASRPKVYPDYHALAVRNAADLFRTMRPEFRACYKDKLAASPDAHASLVFNVLVGPQGAVRTVSMTGGALLGEEGRECLAARVRKATFAPVHGGGTLRIKVPMEFRAVLIARDAGRKP